MMEFEPRRRGNGTFVGGCISGVVLVCVLIGIMAGIWYAALRPQPPAAVELAPQPGAADVTIEVSETFLTQHLQSTLPYTAAVTLDVQPAGSLVAHVVLPVEIGPLQIAPGFTVYSRLQALDGALVAQVNEIEAAGLRVGVDKLPASLQQRIAEINGLLTQQGNESVAANGFTVAAVTTDETSLTIYLQRRELGR